MKNKLEFDASSCRAWVRSFLINSILVAEKTAFCTKHISNTSLNKEIKTIWRYSDQINKQYIYMTKVNDAGLITVLLQV